jgi:two-component system, LytTR family, sensor kinase
MKSRGFWALQIAGWAAFAVALMVPWLGAFPLDLMLWNKLPLVVTGFAVTVALRFAYQRFLRRRAPIWLLALAAAAGSWLGSLAWAGATSFIVHRTGIGAIERGTLIRAAIDRTDETLYFTGVLLAWSLLYFAIAHYRSGVRAQALAQEARLAALRYQIQPHFLFNALNALSTLISERRNEEATRMLEQLAAFLRVTLQGTNTEIPLREEIEFARRYLALESVRFGDRLRARFEVDPGLAEARVPSLILQPLIENAVRYAVSAREDGGSIDVSAALRDGMLVLRVEDDGPGTARASEGIGLSNTRARLAELYGRRQRCEISAREGGGTRVLVELPLSRAVEAA